MVQPSLLSIVSVILVGSTEKNIDCSVLGGGLQVNNPAAFFN
jgi:hypothetical protein